MCSGSPASVRLGGGGQARSNWVPRRSLLAQASVEVFTQAQLSMDRPRTVDDLQNMTPNLTVNYQGFTIQSVNIRGVGNAVGNPNRARG